MKFLILSMFLITGLNATADQWVLDSNRTRIPCTMADGKKGYIIKDAKGNRKCELDKIIGSGGELRSTGTKIVNVKAAGGNISTNNVIAAQPKAINTVNTVNTVPAGTTAVQPAAGNNLTGPNSKKFMRLKVGAP